MKIKLLAAAAALVAAWTCSTGTIAASAEEVCAHEYVVTDISADCTHGGYTLHYCKLCGYEYTDNYTEKTGHNYLSELVTVTGESGHIEYTCSYCGDSYIETCLNKSGHSYKLTTTEPTCISYGYTLYECKTCGDRYITEYIPPAGHEYEDITVEATAESKGYIKHLCKNCSYSYISDITPNEDKTKGEASTNPDNPDGHTHEYILNFSLNETDKLLSLKYVCDCGEDKTGEVTATFVSSAGEIQAFTPNETGEVDYSDLSGNYSLTVTNSANEILMEWDIVGEESNTDAPDTPNEGEAEEQKTNGGSGAGIIIGIIVLLLLVAGGIIGYKVYKKKKSEKNN